MRAGASPIGAMVYTTDGSALVTESNNAIRIWRLSDGVLLKDTIVPNQYIGVVSFTPDGQYAAVSLNPAGGTAGNWSVALVRLSDSTVLTTIDLSHFNTAGQFENFVLSPDATLLAVGTGSGQEGDSNGRVAIYSLPGGTLVNSFPPSGSSVSSCSSCSFMPLAFQGDNQLVVEGYNTAGGNAVMYTAGTFSDGTSMTELVSWPTNLFMGTSPNNQTVMLAIDVNGLYAYPSSGCGSPPSPGCPAVAALNQYFQSNDSGAFSQDSSLYAFWSNSPSISTPSLNLLSTSAWSSLASATVTGTAGPAAFSPNGTTVADSYESNFGGAVLETRSTVDLSVTQTLTQFNGPVGAVTSSHDSTMFATAGNIANSAPAPPPFVKIWNANTGALIQTIQISCGNYTPPCAGGAVDTLAFSPDDSNILVGGVGGVNLYSVATGALTLNLIPAPPSGALTATYSPDGTKIAVDGSGSISIDSATTGAVIASTSWSALQTFPPVFAPDGNSVFAVTFGGQFCSTSGVEQLSTASLSDVRAFCNSLFAIGINATAVSPDGTLLAVGTNDNSSPETVGRVVLLHVSDGTQAAVLVGNTTSVSSLAFSPDGQTIVAGDYNSNLCIWRVSDGTLLETYTQETGANEFTTNPLWSIAFSPNGTKLGYARYDSVAVVAGNPVRLTLTRTASPSTYSTIGQAITFKYTLKNSGTATLSGPFSISDSKLGTIPCGTASLAANASTNCTKIYKVTQADFNAGSIKTTATASGLGVTSNHATATTTAVTVPITVTTSPSGLGIKVDNVSYTAPQTFTWPVHTSHTIDAPSTTLSGTKETFVSWSDGGAQSHKVVATAATTYTATYQTSYRLTVNANPAADGTVSGGGWYNAGSTATVTATANAGFVFTKFTGALTGTTNPQTLVMNAPESVTADFAPLAPTLIATIAGKTNGGTASQRKWTIKITNKGNETASSTQITNAQITLVSGPGPVSLVTPLPVNFGDIAVNAFVSVPITLDFPVTSPATTIQLTLTISANGGAYTTTAVFNNQSR